MAQDIAAELSGRIAALVKEASRSVVRIEGRRGPPSSGTVWSPDGTMVAAHHTIDWDEDIEVGLPDGGTAAAELVGRDATTDLAVLRVASAGLSAPPWKDPDGLDVGHLLLGVSRPGRTVRASLGLVSRLGEAWRTPAGGRIDRYLEADLPMRIGFSGSLLLDLSGGAIGIASAGLVRGEALGVPTPTLRRVVKSLLAHGRVRRGFLGVASIPVLLPPILEKQVGQPAALLLSAVEPESPAARAGLVMGDVLVTINGRPVRHAGDLLPVLEEERIGDEVAVRYVRSGELRDAAIVIGARESAREERRRS